MSMQDANQVLEDAIDRNTAVTLAMPIAGLVQSFPSRLLAVDGNTLWIEWKPGQDAAIDALIKSGEAIKASFRADKLKVEFSTPVLQIRRGYRVNANLKVIAIGLQFPKNVQAIQRRSSYRVSVLGRSELKFRFWTIGAQTDLNETPADGTEITIDVRDFSTGGVGGTWKRRKTGPQSVIAGQRVRVELSQNGESLLIDARLSFMIPVPDPDCRHVGLRFLLEAVNVVDRQKMAKLGQIVGTLQRDELRRTKIAR